MLKNIFFAILFCVSGLVSGQESNVKFLVGTYTNICQSDGIYIFDFDLRTGNFSPYNQSKNVVNPSFLSLSLDSKMVYSVNEAGNESTVSSFNYEENSGSLTLINKQKAEGVDPCHIINDEKNVLVANYSSGSITIFKKSATGSLEVASQTISHYGKSKHQERQTSSHVHHLQFSIDHKYVLATDLGTDKIYVYNYNPISNKEILTIKDSISLKRGSGPRHLTFSPNGKNVYLLQELDGGIIVFEFQDGFLRKLEETQVIDDDFTGNIGAAAIHLSPDGKYLYATNRGSANDITLFTVQKDGRLNYKASYPSGGIGPRDFAIDPTGNYLFIANQKSNSISIFKRDLVSGKLSLLPKTIEVCSPTNIIFIP